VAGRLPAVLDAQLERDAGLNFAYTVMAMLSDQPARTLGMSQLQAANDRILRRIDPEATTRPPAP
jgi:hypothetical protein